MRYFLIGAFYGAVLVLLGCLIAGLINSGYTFFAILPALCFLSIWQKFGVSIGVIAPISDEERGK